jgi:hypothetical protein
MSDLPWTAPVTGTYLFATGAEPRLLTPEEARTGTGEFLLAGSERTDHGAEPSAYRSTLTITWDRDAEGGTDGHA